MSSLRPEDYCPECGCGYKKNSDYHEVTDEGWTGYRELDTMIDTCYSTQHGAIKRKRLRKRVY